MYVWVLLATFMAMLYAFNLSTREDMPVLYNVPQAEAAVSKIVVQHRAAQKYVRDHQPPENGNSVVSYYPGQINIADLQYYLPFGFKRDSEYTSLIYCLNRDSNNLSQAVAGCAASGVSCCSDPKAITYLVTFGCIPSKWRNLFTGKPDNNLLKAIERVVGIGTDFGYADRSDASHWATNETVKSTMAIRGREVTYTSIPQYVISNELSGVGNKSFSKVCVNNAACPYCLIYMTAYQ